MPVPADRTEAPREVAGPVESVGQSPAVGTSAVESMLFLQRYGGNGAVTRLYREPDSAAPDPLVTELRELNGCEIGELLRRLAAKSSDDVVALQGKLASAGVDVNRMRLAIKVCGWHGINEQDFVEIQPILRQLPMDQQDVVARWVGLTGLAAPSHLEAFIAGAGALRDQWAAKTTAQERVALLRPLIDQSLVASKVPPPKDYPVTAIAAGGQWNAEDWKLEITDRLGSMTADEETYARLAATLYHEARHCEQDFLVARLMITQGKSPEAVVARTRMHPDAVNAAKAAGPLAPGSAEENLAKSCFESVYGTGAADRERILGDLGKNNEEYRNLPEESDAHGVGNRVHDGLVTVPPNRDVDAGPVTDPVAGLRK
jgi:hypothetical protein